ncbi:MAG: PHP-associated domain-containing protein, partial [Promethearchaeota archaeon]
MKLNIDLHVHTYASPDCAIVPTHSLIKIMKKKNISGLAITDHDLFINVSRFAKLLKGTGLVVIPGEEVKTTLGGEILCLFINEWIKPGTPGEVMDSVKEQDGIGIFAHPFDHIRGNWIRYLHHSLDENHGQFNEKIDGIEVFNARNYTLGGNRNALQFALRFPKLIQTAGSDAHNLFEIGNSYSIIESESMNLDDIHDAMKKNMIKPLDRETIKCFGGMINYRLCRFLSGVKKKTLSMLNRVLPGFKKWNASKLGS